MNWLIAGTVVYLVSVFAVGAAIGYVVLHFLLKVW